MAVDFSLINQGFGLVYFSYVFKDGVRMTIKKLSLMGGLGDMIVR